MRGFKGCPASTERSISAIFNQLPWMPRVRRGSRYRKCCCVLPYFLWLSRKQNCLWYCNDKNKQKNKIQCFFIAHYSNHTVEMLNRRRNFSFFVYLHLETHQQT